MTDPALPWLAAVGWPTAHRFEAGSDRSVCGLRRVEPVVVLDRATSRLRRCRHCGRPDSRRRKTTQKWTKCWCRAVVKVRTDGRIGLHRTPSIGNRCPHVGREATRIIRKQVAA